MNTTPSQRLGFLHHIRLVPLFACILGGILVLFALSSALAGYFLWQADRDQRDVTAEIEIRTGLANSSDFLRSARINMIQAGAASRIAEMEAMKRNIAQAESEIKQSQQGYRAYQNRPVKTPADEALDTELNQRFQAYITGMQPMLKYAKNGMFEAIINHESEQIDLAKKGVVADLIGAGAIIRTAFCGPCFGAGDTPINNGLSIRHTTRNFPNREGSKPANGQMSAVALMDARSIAATAANGGYLTSASELDCWDNVPEYAFDVTPYKNRVYQGFVKGATQQPLIYGPNIKDWPELGALTDNIVLKVCSKIDLVLCTAGPIGLYMAGFTEDEAKRKTQHPLLPGAIAEFNQYEFSRAMRHKDCQNPLRVYSHIAPYMGGPEKIMNTNGAGDGALAALLHDITANSYHRSNVPNSSKHKFTWLTYSSLAQVCKYANRVSYQVLNQHSPR